MDDGYWEALLLDVENEVECSRSRRGSRESWGEMAAAGPVRNPQRRGNHDFAEQEADWSRAAALLESGEPVAVKVTGYNRGGLLADFGSIQGFVPASHLLNAPLGQVPEARMAELAARIGQVLTVRVAEIDRDRCRLILSERLARQDGRPEDVLASLKPGQFCRGQVTNLCPFGAFVDLGGFEGLIHISELSWGRVGTPDEVVRPGDEVQALVLEVNPAERKVALSLKRLKPDPWQGIEARYQIGQVVDALITNVVSFGAFARLEDGLEGLIHVSELAEGTFLHPRNVIREGDRVRARVMQVDGIKRRIALTLRGPDLPQ